MKLKTFIAQVLSSTALVLSAQEEPDARFTLTGEGGHSLDPRLFGHFLERAWDPELGAEAMMDEEGQPRENVWAALADMKIPMLRFPGGGVVEAAENHWPDFVDHPGNRAEGRKPGGTFGYHEFLMLCEAQGIEPLLVCNFRRAAWKEMPLEEAAALAAGLVAYANAPVEKDLPGDLEKWAEVRAENGHPEPFGVPVFQIGNEWPVWMKGFEKQTGISDLEERVERTVTAFVAQVDAMLAVDPEIKIITDAVAWSKSDREFSAKFLAHPEVKKRADYIAIHCYRPWDVSGKVKLNGEKVELSELSEELRFQAMTGVPNIDAEGQSVFHEGILAPAVENDYPVAMTEWNYNSFGKGASNGVSGSLWAKGVAVGGFVHAILRDGDRIAFANQSMLVGNSWMITGIHVDLKNGGRALRYPSLEVVEFYARHSGNHFVPMVAEKLPTVKQPVQIASIQAVEKLSLIDGVATRSEDKLFVHLINRDFSNSRRVEVDFSAFPVSANGLTLHRLEGELTNTFSDAEPGRLTREENRAVKVRGLEKGRAVFDVPARSFLTVEFLLEKAE